MPIVRAEDAPGFEVEGVTVKGLASPSRGATETMSYRVPLHAGERAPEHAHDHEEVFHVLSGRCVVSLDGEETPLGPGDTVIVPPGTKHFTYSEEGGVDVLAVMPVGTVIIWKDGERWAPPWTL